MRKEIRIGIMDIGIPVWLDDGNLTDSELDAVIELLENERNGRYRARVIEEHKKNGFELYACTKDGMAFLKR